MAHYYLDHEILGRVTVTPRRNSSTFSARWKNGEVHLSVPVGASRKSVEDVLGRLAPRLAVRKKSVRYHDGQVIDCRELKIVIRRQSVSPESVLTSVGRPITYVEVGSGIDLDSPDGVKAVSRLLCLIAMRQAGEILLPRASAIARDLGLRVSRWEISRGHTVLGTCSSDGVIKLSYMLVFLPYELRDYIVYHELAHLTEMSHSPRFHALCDRYCGGRELELKRSLKAFSWPVLKH